MPVFVRAIRWPDTVHIESATSWVDLGLYVEAWGT